MTQDVQAQKISQAMHGLEDSMDIGISEAAMAMALLANYRLDTDMDAVIGQKALARMADAQKHLVEARMKFVAAHVSAKEAYDATNAIPYKCDKPSAKVDAPHHLKVVKI